MNLADRVYSMLTEGAAEDGAADTSAQKRTGIGLRLGKN